MESPPPIDRFRALAASGDWAGAAASLASSREPGDVWLRTAARNVAALRTRRPRVYDQLVTIDAAAELPAEPDAAASRIAQAFADLDPARRAAQAVALAGVGDGALLRTLARHPAELPFGREQGVCVIEPEPLRLLAALGRADLTGPRGPIEQSRFDWYVGDRWSDELSAAVLADRTKVPPQQSVYGSDERPEIDAALADVHASLRDACDADATTIEAYYAGLDDATVIDAFSPAPARRPRVLLITSRFTAVLQYSTRDAADAFAQLGWDARVVCETAASHAMSKHAVRAAIADFKPDLVFQIDHLRAEFGDVIPTALPFVCWIQDHLPKLATAAAAASIGGRDFVLTGAVYRYVGRHGYPRRQCVDMPKVSRAPELPAAWTCDREDLLYVSHWSQPPEAVIAASCGRARDQAGAGAESMMRACTTALSRVYAAGGALRSDLEVRQLARRVFSEASQAIDGEAERFFVDELFQRLNNTLYRQQALLWAGRIADELELKFGIYGAGWETHPELGRRARGVVAYGPDLERLTRESRILLQLEPYACYSHQRMLDAVLCGGFALIREHPLNALPVRFRTFLDAHVPASANTVDGVRAHLDEAGSHAFDAIIADAQILTDLGDPVDVVRGWQRAGTLGDGAEALPHLGAIAFDSFEGLRDRVVHYLGDDAARRRISADQRASVAGRLTYVGALRRVIQTIHGRLRDSVAAAPSSREAEAA